MFSLIFQAFEGRDHRSRKPLEAFQAAFGERGCFMSLASSPEKHTPCELLANLTREVAESKAAILRAADIRVDIVPTTEVANVKHRAHECWMTHRASNGEGFTERNGVVVRGVSLDLKERLEKSRQGDTPTPPWNFELFFNHDHPNNTLDRHGLRMARERGRELGAELTECFPGRRFFLVYRDEQVSFCQATDTLPLGISPGDRRIFDLRVPRDAEAVCFCEVCECPTAYVVHTTPDDEFPHAQFADCVVCENEVIPWADQEIVLASEAARKDFSTPDAPIDAWERSPSEPNLPTTFAALKSAVQERLYPSLEWRDAAIRLWLGCESESLGRDQPRFAQTLLQIEELCALLLAYRVRQLSLPPEEQDRRAITPERLGIARSDQLYHPVRRVLAPITVLTSVKETTSHALLNATDTRYEAGRRLDPNRAVYEGRFWYGIRDIRGRTFWRTTRNGEPIRIINDLAPHAAKPWTCASYGVATSLKFIRERGTERCIAFTVLLDEEKCVEEKRVIAQHRRLFRRFHELDLEPNPTISLDLSDGILTLRSDVFVWGVFLGWHGAGKLPDNAFDLLPGIPYSIPWDESVSGLPRVWRTGNSLFQ